MEIGIHKVAMQAPGDTGELGRLIAASAVIAGTTGDPAVFMSGGTGHQCAPGVAPIASVVRA